MLINRLEQIPPCCGEFRAHGRDLDLQGLSKLSLCLHFLAPAGVLLKPYTMQHGLTLPNDYFMKIELNHGGHISKQWFLSMHWFHFFTKIDPFVVIFYSSIH